VVEPLAHGKHLPVGAEKGRQDPPLLVTSAMAGGGEAHSHIAHQNYRPLSILCLFSHRAQNGRSWPSLTALLQHLAAALNHRALRLHESLLPNREVGALGRGMKESEATYLFGVSLSSVKRYARIIPSIVN
jgi:hypothetical protein